MNRSGLSKYEVERILSRKIEEDPDLKYYMDNEYVLKLINLLIEGIGEVVEENNRDVFR